MNDKIATPDDQIVLIQRSGKVRTLLLNRPEKRNAAGFEMQCRILEAMREIAADPDARVLILAGAGPTFCAGGDMADLRAAGEGKLANFDEFGANQVAMLRTMLSLEIPAVAAVNGAAAGFGAALMAMCDIAVLAEDAVLWDPHVQFGVAPSLILQLLWPRCASLAAARDLLMTGRKIDAAEALRLGLASRICPKGEALVHAEGIAHSFAAMARAGLGMAKRGFNNAILSELDAIRP